MDDNQVTDQGAVSLEEGELHEVSGGLNYSKIEIVSLAKPEPADRLNFTKIEF